MENIEYFDNYTKIKIGVRIKQKHIDDGVEKSGINCPIAKAVRDVWNRPEDQILISHLNLYIRNLSGEWFGTLPGDIRKFIVKFDEGKQVLPIDFSLSLIYFPYTQAQPAPSLKLTRQDLTSGA